MRIVLTMNGQQLVRNNICLNSSQICFNGPTKEHVHARKRISFFQEHYKKFVPMTTSRVLYKGLPPAPRHQAKAIKAIKRRLWFQVSYFGLPVSKQKTKMGASYSGFEIGSNRLPLGYVPPRKGHVTEIQSKDQFKACFDSCKENNKLLVIDFSATWCGPCKFIEPAIKEFAATYSEVEFIKIDVDKFEELARGFEVEAMPTFVLIKNGKEVERVVGAKKDDLQSKIEKHRK